MSLISKLKKSLDIILFVFFLINLTVAMFVMNNFNVRPLRADDSIFSIFGRVTDANNNSIGDVLIHDNIGHTDFTDTSGNYILDGLTAGTYTVTPSKAGYIFAPTSRRVTMPPDATGIDFCSDMDGDALCDDWELHGHNGVDLPTMGADLNRKDIFIEIDYMEKWGVSIGLCAFGHSHKPDLAAIREVVLAFSRAGINLHVDVGPESTMKYVLDVPVSWGQLSRSNRLPVDETISSVDQFAAYKQNPLYFNQNRRGIFHYAISAHGLKIPEHPDWTGGAGEFPGSYTNRIEGAPGDDLIVVIHNGSFPDDNQNCYAGQPVITQAAVFMHELGHNLGLQHGGNEGAEKKPNYLSIMNYLFSHKGLFFNNREGYLDYSSTALPLLEEAHLNEDAGLGLSATNYGTRWYCPGGGDGYKVNSANTSVNWNCNSNPRENPVQVDINGNKTLGDTFQESTSDWDRLVYSGGDIGKWPIQGNFSGIRSIAPSLFSEEPPPDLWQRQPSPFWVSATGPETMLVVPGTTVAYPFTMKNWGDNPDVFTLSVSSSQGWANVSGIPGSISLAAAESREILISVTIPASAPVGMVDILELTARSQGSPNLFDVATARTVVAKSIYLPLIQK